MNFRGIISLTEPISYDKHCINNNKVVICCFVFKFSIDLENKIKSFAWFLSVQFINLGGFYGEREKNIFQNGASRVN